MAETIQLQFEHFPTFVSEYASYLSLGGMFVRTTALQPVGSTVDFDIRLSDGFRLIEGSGDVVWLRSEPGGPGAEVGMGIRFRALDEKGRELVLKILEEQVKGGGQPFDVDEIPADATDSPGALGPEVTAAAVAAAAVPDPGVADPPVPDPGVPALAVPDLGVPSPTATPLEAPGGGENLEFSTPWEKLPEPLEVLEDPVAAETPLVTDGPGLETPIPDFDLGGGGLEDGSSLGGTDLGGADLGGTDLGGADLGGSGLGDGGLEIGDLPPLELADAPALDAGGEALEVFELGEVPAGAEEVTSAGFEIDDDEPTVIGADDEEDDDEPTMVGSVGQDVLDGGGLTSGDPGTLDFGAPAPGLGEVQGVPGGDIRDTTRERETVAPLPTAPEPLEEPYSPVEPQAQAEYPSSFESAPAAAPSFELSPEGTFDTASPVPPSDEFGASGFDAGHFGSDPSAVDGLAPEIPAADGLGTFGSDLGGGSLGSFGEVPTPVDPEPANPAPGLFNTTSGFGTAGEYDVADPGVPEGALPGEPDLGGEVYGAAPVADYDLEDDLGPQPKKRRSGLWIAALLMLALGAAGYFFQAQILDMVGLGGGGGEAVAMGGPPPGNASATADTSSAIDPSAASGGPEDMQNGAEVAGPSAAATDGAPAADGASARAVPSEESPAETQVPPPPVVETPPPSPPPVQASPPPTAPASAPVSIPAGALRVLDIQASATEEGTRVVIQCSRELTTQQVAHDALGYDPRKERLRILAVDADFGSVSVGTAELTGIRTGLHEGPELHLVFDFPDEGLAIRTLSVRGNRVEVLVN